MYKDNPPKIIATVEARMTSSRLPGKVLMDMCGKPVLQHIIERLKRSRYLSDVVVATTINATDEPIVSLCNRLGCSVFRGSEDDVLLRVLEAATNNRGEIIVEICGDCPVIDWRDVDAVIEGFFSGDYDYASNFLGESPVTTGLNVQVFLTAILDKVNRSTSDPLYHEHVSNYIYKNPDIFHLHYVQAKLTQCNRNFDITLDTIQDYEMIHLIYKELYPKNSDFSSEDAVLFLESHPEIASITQNVMRRRA